MKTTTRLLKPFTLTSLAALLTLSIARAADNLPPGKITDLGVEQPTSTSITLTWTAPGNDGYTGTAVAYEIRKANTKITAETWSRATVVPNPPAPAVAGSAQAMSISGLAAGQRYWFAIKASDGTNTSVLSNCAANQLSDINDADIIVFNQYVTSGRDREITRIIQPDVNLRGVADWVGTVPLLRGYDGMMPGIQRLQKDGVRIGYMVASNFLDINEALPPGITLSAISNEKLTKFGPSIRYLLLNNSTAKEYLIYKLKKAVDLNLDLFEIDSANGWSSQDVDDISAQIRDYAMKTKGKKVYFYVNGPPRLGCDLFMDGVKKGFGNNIPAYLKAYQSVLPRPAVQIGDFNSPNGMGGYPEDKTIWPQFTRSQAAQALAGGCRPAEVASCFEELKLFNFNALTAQLNNFKFIRENAELFRNLTHTTPSTLRASVAHVHMSAFTLARRTFVHVVNDHRKEAKQNKEPQSDFTIEVSVNGTVTNVGMTAGNIPMEWAARGAYTGPRKYTALAFAQRDGIVTITVPDQHYYSTIAIDVTPVTPPTLSVSADNVFVSTFGQEQRTIVHVVNGNWNEAAKTMVPQTNFTVKVSVNGAIKAVTMTTPDKKYDERLTSPAYTYRDGIATIRVPALEYYNVIVIDKGAVFRPIYSLGEMAFPFHRINSLPVNNTYKLVALPTEGHQQQVDWRVNGIAGGNATYGTIDADGLYAAPSTVPRGGTVAIQAVSKDDRRIHQAISLTIVPALSANWRETFESDALGSFPHAWDAPEGKGLDVQVGSDQGLKVLHNYSPSPTLAGSGEMVVSGDARWTDYSYSFDVKQVKDRYNAFDQRRRGVYVGAVFRYQDYANYWQYRLCLDDTLRLYRTVNGKQEEVGTGVPVPFPATGTSVNFMVTVAGTTATALIDHVKMRSDAITGTRGGIGISFKGTMSYYKNISVSSVSRGAPQRRLK